MLYKTYLYFYNFFINYPTPANLTNVWNFGILSFFFLIVQIVSGIGLSMYYVPTEEFSFVFVEYIMRDTYFGWFFRYIHSNGASMFFFVVYLHFLRGIFYLSYVNPKTLIWNTGVIILLLMIITAFTGYVLPWGQMSFWACTVITNLASAFPEIGEELVKSIWGSYGVSTITLNRFYTIHFILPFVILFIMIVHFYYLHKVGSSNGTKIFDIEDKKRFHPYYTWKDVFVVVGVVSGYIFLILSTPNYLSHTDNYIPADPMVTPEHIVPEWYFLPFYAMLRAVPTKIGGIIVLSCSILVLFILPNQIKNLYHYDFWHKAKCDGLHSYSVRFFSIVTKRTNPLIMDYLFWIFAANFVFLGYLGMQPIEEPYIYAGKMSTYLYFLYFFSASYIHSYSSLLAQIKGVYIQDALILFEMIKNTLLFFSRVLKNLIKKYFPGIYVKLFNFYIMTKKFINNNLISENTFETLYKKCEDFAKKTEKWQADYEKNRKAYKEACRIASEEAKAAKKASKK